MKQNDIRTFWASLLLLVMVMGCGSSGQKTTTEAPAPIKDEPSKPPPQTKSVYINDQENVQLASISIEAEEVYLQLAAKELFGVKTKADKRKYYDGADVMHYAVKYSEDGLKLRDQAEQLLWKVKFSDTGIKLSANEEMTGAYKISKSGEGKLKLKKNDDEVAALRFKVGKGIVKVGEKYLLNGFSGSLAMGLLLIEEIPEEQKFLLIAEVVGAGE